jgi:hypothetical protein
MLKHSRKQETLVANYIKTQGHLIGSDAEIWELTLTGSTAKERSEAET